jgi:acyl-CoA synthetase (AMP-forming)/AMP-acid ligase II
VNGDEAIGELVNRAPNPFEGYWKNQAADTERTRRGWFWSGDLFFRDQDGWFHFAGRAEDRLRVDGENLAAAVVEEILARFPDAVAAAVRAVPDPASGDQVMAALALREGAGFDPDAFAAFLAGQPDLGAKIAPRVRPDRDIHAGHGDEQGAPGPAAPGGVPLRRPGVVVAAGHRAVRGRVPATHRRRPRRPARRLPRPRPGSATGPLSRPPGPAPSRGALPPYSEAGGQRLTETCRVIVERRPLCRR